MEGLGESDVKLLLQVSAAEVACMPVVHSVVGVPWKRDGDIKRDEVERERDMRCVNVCEYEFASLEQAVAH